MFNVDINQGIENIYYHLISIEHMPHTLKVCLGTIGCLLYKQDTRAWDEKWKTTAALWTLFYAQ